MDYIAQGYPLPLLCAQKAQARSIPLVPSVLTWRAPEAQSQLGWHRPQRRRSKPWKKVAILIMLPTRTRNLSSIAKRKGSLKSLPRNTSSSRDQEVPLSSKKYWESELKDGSVADQKRRHRDEYQGRQSVEEPFSKPGRVGPTVLVQIFPQKLKSKNTLCRSAATLLLLSILTVSLCGDVNLWWWSFRSQENLVIGRSGKSHFETTISGSPRATGIHCLSSSLIN